MNPLLLAPKSNNSHPALTGKLLLTLSGPSVARSLSICGSAFLACWWFQEQFLIEAYESGERTTLTFSILCTQPQEMLKFPKVTKAGLTDKTGVRHMHTNSDTENKRYTNRRDTTTYFLSSASSLCLLGTASRSKEICLINSSIIILRLAENNLRLSDPHSQCKFSHFFLLSFPSLRLEFTFFVKVLSVCQAFSPCPTKPIVRRWKVNRAWYMITSATSQIITSLEVGQSPKTLSGPWRPETPF